MQHRTYTKNRPSTQNDSFLRHWCVYSNDGLDDVCVVAVKAFWRKVSRRVQGLLWIRQKSLMSFFFSTTGCRRGGGGICEDLS